MDNVLEKYDPNMDKFEIIEGKIEDSFSDTYDEDNRFRGNKQRDLLYTNFSN